MAKKDGDEDRSYAERMESHRKKLDTQIDKEVNEAAKKAAEEAEKAEKKAPASKPLVGEKGPAAAEKK